MYPASKLLMLGLRGSGKTTFLAALWHYLESSEIPGRLTLPQLQPNREYVNTIRNNWLALNPVGRTSMRSTAQVSLSLLDAKTGGTIELSFPDLSGESFRLQWATRKAAATYVQYAEDCAGSFLFIHPQDISKTTAFRPDADPGNEEAKGAKPIPHSKNWTAAQTSMQVQLVDVLQNLLRLRNDRGVLPIAVVISAWDILKATIPPAIWVERRVPLLSQFLRANPDRIAAEIFGVSAQGGDLTADRAALLKIANPSERCKVVQGDSLEPNRITKPVEFLLDANKIGPD